MIYHALFWLFLNILSIIILAFYSMSEMACVSFNKVRLQYYVAKGNKRAVWLNWLLHHPTRLFGTTLIGVNVATFFGSEFAREFHAAIGIDPDFSPISQVILVVIFGELAPMFAARRYAEHVAMLSVPLIYASAKILAPAVWAMTGLTRFISFVIGKKEPQQHIFLTQEEIEKILEEKEEERPTGHENEDFNAVTSNIFRLSGKEAYQVMEPIATLPKVSSNATVMQGGNILQKSNTDYIAVFHRDPQNIVGIAYAQDLVRAADNRRLREFTRTPWFVTQKTNLLQILNQFRSNHENLAIVLDEQGKAEGVIHLHDVVEEIFGTISTPELGLRQDLSKQAPFIDRTLPGFMNVGDFNARFGVILDKREDLSLSELITEELGHHPEVGESIYVDPFELTIEATSFLEIKSIHVTTVLR
jgi:putative hemolysin